MSESCSDVPNDIPPGIQIKVFLKNGMNVEGRVVYWNKESGFLTSEQGSYGMLFYRPEENVLMIQVELGSSLVEPAYEGPPEPPEPPAPPPPPPPPPPTKQAPNRLSQVAQKKIQNNQELRKKIAEKLHPAQLDTSPPIQSDLPEEKLSRFGLEKYVVPNFKK